MCQFVSGGGCSFVTVFKKMFMKKICCLLLPLLMVGCSDDWNRGECRVHLSFSEDFGLDYRISETKGGSSINLPDTNDFILSIKDMDSGEELFRDVYSNRPSVINLAEGKYSIGVYSSEFDEPAFDIPVFGDEHTLYIEGADVDISFVCKQLNSGLRMVFDESFKEQFPSSKVVVKQEEHLLSYPYTEDRIAFFSIGKVDMFLATGEKSSHLLTRVLEENEVLTIHFSADLSSESDANFRIAIDTGRVWISEDYIYGKERDGSSKTRALFVKDAVNLVGSEDVWIKGYIVGGDLSSSGALYSPPFSSKTNFMISDDRSVGSREGCMAVELKSGAIREGLNLVDNPEYYGRAIYLKGNIVEKYYGLPGIKNISEYSFD